MKLLTSFFVLSLLTATFAARLSAATSGEEVYQTRCARCHDQVTERVPPRAVLQKMPAARILRALDAGAMMAVAFTISRDDRMAVASYLGTNATVEGPSPAAFCSNRTVRDFRKNMAANLNLDRLNIS